METTDLGQGGVYLDADTIQGLLSYADCVSALREMFLQVDPETLPLRSRMPFDKGELLMMPAAYGSVVGVKLVTVKQLPDGSDLPSVHAVYTLFSATDGSVLATLDATRLTGVRTAAVSALAAQALGMNPGRKVVVWGTGVQARAHAEAFTAILGAAEVVILGRSQHKTDALARELAAGGVPARSGSDTGQEVASADAIITCTASPVPLFDGDQVSDHAFVFAVGAHDPASRELDGALLARSNLLVESRTAAFAEAGEIALALQEGALEEPVQAHNLSELLRREAPSLPGGRPTVFKSVGMAVEDLALVLRAYESWQAAA